jgi:hypothetical protein
MSVDEESIKDTYKKLSDLTEQLTSLTTMSKVVANTALLHDIHNQLAALNSIKNNLPTIETGSTEDHVNKTAMQNIQTQTNEECGKAEELIKRTEKLTGEVKKSFNVWNKALGLNKMARFLLFVFMFFFIFKIIDHILDFFDVNKDIGYIYFVWFTIMFFLFVVLPLQRSRLQPTPKQQES